MSVKCINRSPRVGQCGFINNHFASWFFFKLSKFFFHSFKNAKHDKRVLRNIKITFLPICGIQNYENLFVPFISNNSVCIITRTSFPRMSYFKYAV